MVRCPNVKLNDAIHEFLTHCEVGKYQSKKTIENYHHYLKRFMEFVGPTLDVSKIDAAILRNYRLHLYHFQVPGEGTTLGIRTQQYHLIALRALLTYLVKEDIATLPPEKVELPKVPGRQVDALTREELDTLMTSIDTNERTGLRDLALLHLLYSTGLRVSELCNLNRDDVNFKTREFRVLGKGRKTRIVFISETACKHLQNYLQNRLDNFDPLFISNSNRSKGTIIDGEGRRMQPQAVERVVRTLTTKAGILKKVTPHTLRHTFATELLRNGADIRAVQEMLGHASITTTQIYTHITNQRLREVHTKYHK